MTNVSSDPDYPRGGGQGEDGVRDDEAVSRPRDAPEHDPEEPAGAGEHAERDGRAAGQNQQDVRHARQVQGRPHSPSVDVESRYVLSLISPPTEAAVLVFDRGNVTEIIIFVEYKKSGEESACCINLQRKY